MQLLIGLASGLVLFLCVLIAYITGWKHCKEFSKGNIPKLNLNPVEAVKKHIEEKEDKKKAKDEHESWYGENGIMNYDPYKEVKR